MKNPMQCPCGSDKPYHACCQPYHDGKPVPTAEALMRSRYTAYVLHLDWYLLHTWHPSTRPPELTCAEDEAIKWLGLQVKRHESSTESRATVEFIARYKIAGKAERLHEISDFIKIDGQWYYLDGHHPST
jgi:SEC-C motif domain protein